MAQLNQIAGSALYQLKRSLYSVFCPERDDLLLSEVDYGVKD